MIWGASNFCPKNDVMHWIKVISEKKTGLHKYCDGFFVQIKISNKQNFAQKIWNCRKFWRKIAQNVWNRPNFDAKLPKILTHDRHLKTKRESQCPPPPHLLRHCLGVLVFSVNWTNASQLILTNKPWCFVHIVVISITSIQPIFCFAY